MVARIYKPSRSAMQSGKGKSENWLLEFETEAPRTTDPLMGWTSSGDTRQQLKSLIRTYFALGGMQLQINVVDQRVLQDALEHPERYGDLIVRVGGYSEYFNQLSRDLQLSILERVEHE